MMVNNQKPNGEGVGRIYKAFKCSVKGFYAAFKHEAAFRQEVLLAAVLFPVSFIVADSMMVWLMLNFSLLFLLVTEIINSAIEVLADKITLEYDEMIGRAKDLGSAAVFIATLFVAMVWFSVLFNLVFVK